MTPFLKVFMFVCPCSSSRVVHCMNRQVKMLIKAVTSMPKMLPGRFAVQGL